MYKTPLTVVSWSDHSWQVVWTHPRPKGLEWVHNLPLCGLYSTHHSVSVVHFLNNLSVGLHYNTVTHIPVPCHYYSITTLPGTNLSVAVRSYVPHTFRYPAIGYSITTLPVTKEPIYCSSIQPHTFRYPALLQYHYLPGTNLSTCPSIQPHSFRYPRTITVSLPSRYCETWI